MNESNIVNSDYQRKADELLAKANKFRWELGDDYHDKVVEDIYAEAGRIASRSVTYDNKKQRNDWDMILDRIVINKYSGFLIMFVLLAIVLWLTVQGANYPSSLLASLLLDDFLPVLHSWAAAIHLPAWFSGILIDGGYLAMAWVVSVMLPPMAIFFPLFTLLEDFGYLPRVAFNMDNLFRKVGAHGKQALTMSMGFGCNAAGVVATRIIDSPRERIIAIITNNFALCNGRWPTQILLATIFIGALVPPAIAGLVSAGAVIAVALLGVFLTLVVSWSLSKTMLKGEASAFSLELPPYRPPRLLQTLYTSLIDRTIYVLWRAIIFAFPAGLVIWLMANVNIGGLPIAKYIVDFVDPAAIIFGLNGIIILAYIIAIPANEIVIPTILMLTVLMHGVAGYSHGVLFELDSVADTAQLLHIGGWTLLTAINVMVFSLVHNPCSTTIYTIYKETGSIKWTSVATFLPLILGFVLTFFITQVWHLF
jgi:ferrous iron transport protein B